MRTYAPVPVHPMRQPELVIGREIADRSECGTDQFGWRSRSCREVGEIGLRFALVLTEQKRQTAVSVVFAGSDGTGVVGGFAPPRQGGVFQETTRARFAAANADKRPGSAK